MFLVTSFVTRCRCNCTAHRRTRHTKPCSSGCPRIPYCGYRANSHDSQTAHNAEDGGISSDARGSDPLAKEVRELGFRFRVSDELD